MASRLSQPLASHHLPSLLLVCKAMSTEVRTPDVTGALWCLPPVLCGLAASEASRPVYLSVSSLLFQKGPVAPAVAVTAPQQTPVVMAPQALAQAPSQPVQPPQSGIAAAPGGPVVSQVRFPVTPSPRAPCTAHTPPSRVQALSQLPAGWLCHELSPRTYSLAALHSWTRIESLTHAHTCSRPCIHTSAYQPKDMQA